MKTVGSRCIFIVSVSYLSLNIPVLNTVICLICLCVNWGSSYLEWPWLRGCEDLGLLAHMLVDQVEECDVGWTALLIVSLILPGASGFA